VRWDGGGAADLGIPDGYLGSCAFALNDTGQLAGSLTTAEMALNGLYLDHAASWQNGAWRDLGTLAANTSSRALGINAVGQIVGSAETTKSDGLGGRVGHGVLWQTNALIDLNSRIDLQSGWEILSANAINDHGQIVGQGIIHGERHAVLLTPAS
jgi:uncharacterized membrane protein